MLIWVKWKFCQVYFFYVKTPAETLQLWFFWKCFSQKWPLYYNNEQNSAHIERLIKWGPCQGCARTGRQILNYCFWKPSCDTLSRRDENGVYGIDLHNALLPVARGRWVVKAGLRLISRISRCKEVSGQMIWSCSVIWFSVEGCWLQLCQPLSAHQARQVNKPPSPLIGYPEWCDIGETQTMLCSSPSPCRHLSSDI